LIKALTQNQTLEGNFKFFRPNPTGDGTTQQFYTVEFKGAHIESMKQFVPDTIKPASTAEPPMEEITITYSSITYSYMNSATTRTKAG
jgi:type VI secretion system secreted protein Hcp